MQSKYLQWCISSPIGALYLVASEKSLKGIFWKKQDLPILNSLTGSSEGIKTLAQAAKELKEYFEGQRQRFTVPLDINGTPFQKRVWKELQKIPYGKICTYKDIAQRIHHPKAFRAVGTANGKNVIPIIIPCHRVIAADGSLGGYAGGLKIKTALLKHELLP